MPGGASARPTRPPGGGDRVLPAGAALLLQAFDEDTAALLLDPSGFVGDTGAGVEALLGYDRGELVGRHLSCLHPPRQIAEGLAGEILAAAETDGRMHLACEIVRADRSAFRADVTVTALLDDDGALAGFLHLVREAPTADGLPEAVRAATPAAASFERVARNLAEVALVTVDRDWVIRFWNRGAERIFGVPVVEAEGSSFLRFVPEQDVSGGVPGRHLEAALAKGGDRTEAWLVRAGGERFWAACVIGAPCSGEGAPQEIGLVIRDIGEHDEASAGEEELRRRLELQARLARVAATAPGVIHEFRRAVDGTPSFPYASPAFETLYGVPPEEVAHDARDLFSRVHPDDGRAIEAAIVESAATMALFRAEFRYDHPTRGEIWIEASSAPAREPDGAVVWHGFLRDVTEQKRMELEMERSRRRLEEAQRVGRVGSFEYDLRTQTVDWSAEHLRIFDIAPGEALPIAFDDFLELVHPFDRGLVRSRVEEGSRTGRPFEIDYRIVKRDGTTAWIHAHGVFELDAEGRPVRQRGTVQDVTLRRNLEEQLRQSQKMEAIGRLAGGVAHDFNNLLTVITGHTDLLLSAPISGADRRSLESIHEAAEHAASLTRRLLAFSRNQVLDVRTIDLDDVVRGLESMLARIVGENIVLELRSGAPGTVRADVGQIEQVLLNLVVNARDAMPRGGQLTISTSLVDVPPGLSGIDAEIAPGPYVELTVADTGEGMEPEVAERAFEPFFTTKETGKGTGLGLAMVFGIVRQSGGHITVESVPGKGTSMRLLLPPAAADAPREPRPREPGPARASAGTVLLVEDDAGVRSLTATALNHLGYRVLQATDGTDALTVVAGVSDPIDLLLSDVMMPRMGGVELARTIRSTRPSTRIVLMSGYASGIDRDDIDGLSDVFLAKPFSSEDLAAAVAGALARR